MRGMRERALLVGGVLAIKAGRGGGLEVRLEVPAERRRLMPVPLVTRVLVADDHPIVRSGLRKVLDAQPDLEVVAEAADGAEAVELALANHVDLAILDVSMPRMTGIQAATELRKRRPETKVLMLSMYDNEQFLYESLRAGASGYVLKSDADHDIVEACRQTMRGQSFLYPSAVTTLVRDYIDRGKPDDQFDILTPRELRGAEADRGGAPVEGDRQGARDQHQDGRAPPREHPRQARDERPGRAHPVRDPPWADPA